MGIVGATRERVERRRPCRQKAATTAEKLIAQARANMPQGRPSVENVELRLRRLLEALLAGNDYDGNPDGAPARSR